MERIHYSGKIERIYELLKRISILSRFTFLGLGLISTLFISQDLLAIESVGFDFLLEEYKNKPSNEKYPYFAGTDDYLLQSADPDNWAPGVEYDPENDGSLIGNLGVYEHWNNALNKEYSRNLGTGDGIELEKVFLIDQQITTENSGLLSDKVTKIFVDSFDVKWFGTDNGISRFNGTDWDTINSDNHLLNNIINDLAYEKGDYGHELWVATDSGLSVMAYDIDGVTSATTYIKDNSGMINDTVTAVGVDILHNRWIGTPEGINVFSGSDWDTTYSYINEDHIEESLDHVLITSIGSFEPDSMAFITTDGKGVIRFRYDEIDGFTGASAYQTTWSRFETNSINSVTILDSMQWYGTDDGLYVRKGPYSKQYPLHYTTSDGLVDNNVNAVEMDDDGNIWIGTNDGLNVKSIDGWYKYTSIEGIINPFVNDIKKDFSGNIWIATNGGVEFFSGIPGVLLTPSVQDSGLIFENITTVSADIAWTIGNGIKRVAFIKEGTDGVVSLANNDSYSASTVFGVGTAIGGWYCIYNGTGSNVSVSGLDINTGYRVMVCGYSGTSGEEQYLTSTASGNPGNFSTLVSSTLTEIIKKEDIYPNPFHDFIEIKTNPQDKEYNVAIFGIDGKVYLKSLMNRNAFRLNTSGLKEGVYIIQIYDNVKISSYKMVKQ